MEFEVLIFDVLVFVFVSQTVQMDFHNSRIALNTILFRNLFDPDLNISRNVS